MKKLLFLLPVLFLTGCASQGGNQEIVSQITADQSQPVFAEQVIANLTDATTTVDISDSPTPVINHSDSIVGQPLVPMSSTENINKSVDTENNNAELSNNTEQTNSLVNTSESVAIDSSQGNIEQPAIAIEQAAEVSVVLTKQAKDLISRNIDEFDETIKDCDEFNNLINQRTTLLRSKISNTESIIGEMATIGSSASASLTDVAIAIKKEYENEITTMDDYKDNLVKTRAIFSAQQIKLVGLDNLLDPDIEIDDATYQKILEAVGKDSSLYSDTSTAIGANIQNFKLSATTNDAQYKKWWDQFWDVVGIVQKNLDIPEPSKQYSGTTCYVNTNFNGSISSITCY